MKRVILLGAGKSIQEGIKDGLWDKIRDEDAWSLNSMFKIMPYLPERQVWVDKEFWNHEIQNMHKLARSKVELIAKANFKLKPFDHFITTYNTSRLKEDYYGKKALEKNVIYYGRMGLVGSFALSVAIARGYDEIFLLGYDFGSASLADTNTHVYQDRMFELNIKSSGAGNPEVYRTPDGKLNEFIEDWQVYVNEEVKIYNVSLISNLEYFPKISYEEFFERLS
jgi:hypothetical protein